MLQMKNELSGMKRSFVKMLVSIGTDMIFIKKFHLSLVEKDVIEKKNMSHYFKRSEIAFDFKSK